MSHWQASVKAGLAFAKMLAQLTEADWDDAAVTLLSGLMDNEAFVNFINSLLGEKARGALDVKSPMFASDAEQFATPELKAAVEAAGFDWTAFLEKILPIILKMVALFANT